MHELAATPTGGCNFNTVDVRPEFQIIWAFDIFCLVASPRRLPAICLRALTPIPAFAMCYGISRCLLLRSCVRVDELLAFFSLVQCHAWGVPRGLYDEYSSYKDKAEGTVRLLQRMTKLSKKLRPASKIIMTS